MLFGEEGVGLTKEALNLAEYAVEIPQFGSVRSLNVGTCSGILMYDYVMSLQNSKDFYESRTKKYDGTCSVQSESSQLSLL